MICVSKDNGTHLLITFIYLYPSCRCKMVVWETDCPDQEVSDSEKVSKRERVRGCTVETH